MFLSVSQFVSVPDNYDEVYLCMARRGARVLALGYKMLGKISRQEVHKCCKCTVFMYMYGA